ncbi:MAG: hypothetical protein KAI24_23310 [Planctomycetes bacterium]|nr:hypothetical protein [Planctomycetota bacterium]
MSPGQGKPSPGRRLGSAYFLGIVFAAFAILLWLRGMGRLLIPAILIGLVCYGIYRFVQLVRAPVD